METVHYLKTGIPGFDELLGKGILRESILTLSGPTGSGKTTFAMQFLVEGANKFQEPGLYISLEDSKKGLLMHMSQFKWELEKMEARKQLFFLDYPVYEVGQFLEKENAIGEIVSSMGIERVVIDSIMPIALSFKDEDHRRKEFLNLISNIKRWGATTMIISEDTTPVSESIMPTTTYDIEKLSDGWIHLSYMASSKGERERGIEIIKMKGTRHSMKKANLELGDYGFIVLGDPSTTKTTKERKPKI
ncbi:MAG: ATPase domain-containing protein [Candidatus ainarchaeum sp.]|nr:ATPase domain-containing protein [Candidatus ainarchaeum sp.]